MRYRFCCVLSVVAFAATPLVHGAEPATADPALEVVEKLLAQLKEEKAAQPAEPETPPSSEPAEGGPSDRTPRNRQPIDPIAAPVDGPLTPESVIDEVARRGDEQEAKRARNAMVLFEQAKAAEQVGKLAEALRLASSARRLDPKNAEISEYLTALQQSANDSKSASGTYGKAAAHLAAGLTRGQLLMERNRFADAADLLSGVVRAADLFPAEANVSIYRRLAVKELENYKARVAAGQIQPAETDAKAPASGEEPILVATGSAAPENARRVLREIESQTPTWYSQAKNRLSFRMSVNYPNTPISLIVEDVAKQTGLKILFDDAVVRSRAHLNAKLDLRVSDVPAETILDLACLKSGLEYVIMERAILVTTPARAVRYIQDLPDALRDNWAAARVIFPDLNPELLAAPPLPNALPGQNLPDRAALDRDVPPYLRSGDALVADIQSLLR